MAKFTKEQEIVAAQLATGSAPGVDYEYPFTQEEVTSDTLNAFLQTWQSRQAVVTADMETKLAVMATGSPYGKDYNSQFQGKPVLEVLSDMIAFWLGQRQQPSRANPVEAVTLKPGTYLVQ